MKATKEKMSGTATITFILEYLDEASDCYLFFVMEIEGQEFDLEERRKKSLLQQIFWNLHTPGIVNSYD